MKAFKSWGGARKHGAAPFLIRIVDSDLQWQERWLPGEPEWSPLRSVRAGSGLISFGLWGESPVVACSRPAGLIFSVYESSATALEAFAGVCWIGRLTTRADLAMIPQHAFCPQSRQSPPPLGGWQAHRPPGGDPRSPPGDSLSCGGIGPSACAAKGNRRSGRRAGRALPEPCRGGLFAPGGTP